MNTFCARNKRVDVTKVTLVIVRERLVVDP